MFEAFAIGPFLIWMRLLFLLIGIWIAFEFFLRLARGKNMSLQHMREHALTYLIAFVLGGRLVAIIALYRVYMRDPLRIFIFWDGGFSFIGGVLGIAAVLYWVTRAHRSTFLEWLDVLLPATTIGLVFDWIGKFAAGHSYGKPTDLFIGVTYDTMGVRYAVPVHPVQLYYALFFLILTFLILVTRKYANRAGSETLACIVLATVATFIFEYFRGDFSIPVFATRMDFVVLLLLFISLGVFAALELSLSKKGIIIYQAVLILLFGGYLLARPHLPFASYELRFSQFLSVLALLGTIVYVLVHRKKYPHL